MLSNSGDIFDKLIMEERFCTFQVKGEICGKLIGPNTPDSTCFRCKGILRQRKYRKNKKEEVANQSFQYSKEETLTELPEYIALQQQEQEWERARGKPLDREEFPISKCTHVKVGMTFKFWEKLISLLSV